MSNLFKAVIYGPAATQGSKCQFPHPKTGEMVMIEANPRSRPWRQELIQEMLNEQPNLPYDEAVFFRVRVYVNRPSDHFKKDGSLKTTAPRYPKSGKDNDKIERAIGDAAKIAYWVRDDSRICDWDVKRRYTTEELEPERVEVVMWSLEQFGEDFYDRVMSSVNHVKSA